MDSYERVAPAFKTIWSGAGKMFCPPADQSSLKLRSKSASYLRPGTNTGRAGPLGPGCNEAARGPAGGREPAQLTFSLTAW